MSEIAIFRQLSRLNTSLNSLSNWRIAHPEVTYFTDRTQVIVMCSQLSISRLPANKHALIDLPTPREKSADRAGKRAELCWRGDCPKYKPRCDLGALFGLSNEK